MGKEQFIGTWKLVSSEFRRQNSEVTYPLGMNAVGLLMYDAHGNVSVQVMNPDRTPFAMDSQLMGNPSEIKPAFEGYVAYFGTYEVNEAKGIIIHHIAGSLFPNWIDTDQERFFEFTEDTLILRTSPIVVFGEQSIGFLVWKRVR